MRIVYSLWTKPFADVKQNTGGWWAPQYHWYSWILSVMQAHFVYGNCHLVTDSEGARMLVDTLRLPFQSVTVALDDLQIDPRLWAMGKIVANSLQEEPFIQIDSDVYFWKKLPEKLTKSRLIAQNMETPETVDFVHSYEIPHKMLVEAITFLPQELVDAEMKAYCCGVFGGNDMEAIRSHCKMVLDILTYSGNKEAWKDFGLKCRNLSDFNCLLEQMTYYVNAKKLDIPVECVFPEGTYSEQYAREIGFTHVMLAKRNHLGFSNCISGDLEQRIAKDYPDHYRTIQSMFSKGGRGR